VRLIAALLLLLPVSALAPPARAQCLVGPHPWEPPPATFDAMLVATHPDDELVPFRGLLPRLASQGKTVLVVVTADDGVALRREATRNAVWTAGLRHEPVFLGLDDACFGQSFDCALTAWGGLGGAIAALTELIDQYQPAALYTQDAIEGENDNPQHLATSLSALTAALRSAHRPATIVVHRWPRGTIAPAWTPAEEQAAEDALECHAGTIPGGNDPTFHPDQGFVFGRWEPASPEGVDDLPDGSDPPGWLETGAANSLDWSDAFAVVGSAYRTTTEDVNVHAHWMLPARSRYEYTGRMRYDAYGSGVGVTFLSDHPHSDRYYRLRRGAFLGETFHLSPHGTAFTSGTTDTGVVPAQGAWYRFRVAAEAGDTETAVRARVWPDGSPEPAGWQAVAVDASATRLTAGVAGVWAMDGSAGWDDLELIPTCEASDVCLTSETCVDGVCREEPLAVAIPSASGTARAVLALLLLGAAVRAHRRRRA
jgi:LmbE family N-acetylglucosaminyl deacetylase